VSRPDRVVSVRQGPSRRGSGQCASARPRGGRLEGRGRPVRARFLHVFDFDDGLISRESAWIDLAAIQQQLAS
jgi:ketosteroid isomerase-like protein